MGLREYKRKRNFERTPEPEGKHNEQNGRSYVIQKHAARHLHYDFRLELDGVLKSWAVPKGPSLDPAVKRLAMHVEDHPVEYGVFEGVIPEGEYGGGTVMLWDRGTWEPIGDPDQSYRDGKLKFRLEGKKLHGGWMLVRINGKQPTDKEQRQWLLVKERDKEAKSTDDFEVVKEQPLSVATRRSMEKIASDRDRVWNAKSENDNGEAIIPRKTSARKAAAPKKTVRRSISAYDAAKQQYAGVRLTSPDKILYDEDGITKLELAEYYRSVAKWILPHIEDRPLVLVRCPEGQQKACFYQKHPAPGTPDTLRQIAIREGKKTAPYVLVDDVAGLISLAQIGALEVHAWGSRSDKLESPDRLIFDLDPGPRVAWNTVVQSALQIRDFLRELSLESFVKTTGGKGLHLVVPIDRRHEWGEAKAFCKAVADLIVTADPKHYTANMSKAVRPGRIFIDYLRNGRGATAIVPYSTRSRPGAPVSVPLAWDELSPRTHSDHFTIRNMGRRLASLKKDPWQGLADMRQSLSGPIKKVRALA